MLLSLCSAAIIFGSPVVAVATASAQAITATPDSIVERYSDWRVTCTKQTETNLQECLMSQKLMQPNAEQPVMTIYVRPEVDDGDARMTFLVPLRVSLMDKVRATINEEQVLSAPYQSCTPRGCLARAVLDQEAIKAFRAAESSVVAFNLANSQLVKITISLNGFSAAWERMHFE